MTPEVPILVETDSRSRVVLPGYRNRRFLLQVQEDGSLLLQPAVVFAESQLEYLTNTELRELLSRAAASPTVSRGKRARLGE